MTELATIRAIDVSRPFSGCIYPVVTGYTSLTADVAVIEIHLPGGGLMTGIALVGGGYMMDRLADRDIAVVTTGANTDHLGVIHPHRWHPNRCVMTSLAGRAT